MPIYEINWNIQGVTRIPAKDAAQAQERFDRLNVRNLVSGEGNSRTEFTQTAGPGPGRAIKPAEYPGWHDTNGKFARSEKAARLIDAHGGRVLRFRDLPVNAQCALVQYMAIDGEAWTLPDSVDAMSQGELEKFVANMPDHLGFYLDQYADLEFGYIEKVPLKDLIESVITDEDCGYDSFAEYHDWYMNHSPKHEAKDMWPVILSGFSYETLQDGWTRFHQYCERHEATCPALFYLERDSDNETRNARPEQ